MGLIRAGMVIIEDVGDETWNICGSLLLFSKEYMGILQFQYLVLYDMNEQHVTNHIR